MISDAGAHACKTCGADLGDALFQPLPPAFKPGSPSPAANRELPEPVPSWDTPMFILDPPGSGVPPAKDAKPVRGAAPVQAKPAGLMTKPVAVAAAIVAVLAMIAVLASRHDANDTASRPAAASGAVTVAPAPSEPESKPAVAPTIVTTPPVAAPARAAAAPAAAAPRVRSDAAPPPPRGTVEPAPASAPPATRLGPCTEAVAALGLCTLPAAPAKEP